MFAGEAKGKYGKMKCEGVNTSSSSESVVAAITTSNSSREGFQRDNFDVVRFNPCKLLGPKTPHFIKLEIALKNVPIVSPERGYARHLASPPR